MKRTIDFLRETLWVLYALYFQPTALQHRRYLSQVALLCALAALPLFMLVPSSTQLPHLIMLGLTCVIIVAVSLSVALWQSTLGPVTALTLALLCGASFHSGEWLAALVSLESIRFMLEIIRIMLVDFFIGLAIGILFGLIGRLLLRYELEIGILAVFIVEFVVLVTVYRMLVDTRGFVIPRGGTLGSAAILYTISFMFNINHRIGETYMGCIAVIVGIVPVILTVSGIIASVVSLSSAPMPIQWLVAGMLGLSLSARRWHRRDLLLSILILGGLALIFLPDYQRVILWLLVGVFWFIRLPLLLLYASWTTVGYFGYHGADKDPLRVLASTPWRWDELISIPLPYVEQLLVLAAQQDRRAGLAYIEEAAATWRQDGPAQRAQVRLATEDLARCTSERAIAGAADDLRWLPETLPRTVADTLGRFRTVSRMVDDKLITTGREAQLVKLSAATAELDSLIQGLTFVPARERELFLPIAHSWREVLKRAGGRLPNPYVAGNPLQTGAAGLFVGRENVLRQLQAHLRDRSQRPALLLFGQRRMGKSSLLYQLPAQLDEGVAPVSVDCLAGEMQESNGAFLFKLGRTIHSQALDQCNLSLPPPPTLTESTFTSFSLWLEQVEAVLDQRTLLLSFDEFEALGVAIEKGWMDERVLGFLRNLIQHHPKIDVLLAGSHRPQELGLLWSSYLISVQVLEIAYLDSHETRRLIEQPIPGFGLHYQSAAVDHIIALTHCQPLLVQLLCQELVHLLNERGEREATVNDVEAVIPRAFTRGSTLYFQYLQDDAGAEGNAILTQLAKLGPKAAVAPSVLTGNQPAFQTALQRLLDRDLVEEVAGGIRFEVELVRRWWAGQPS